MGEFTDGDERALKANSVSFSQEMRRRKARQINDKEKILSEWEEAFVRQQGHGDVEQQRLAEKLAALRKARKKAVMVKVQMLSLSPSPSLPHSLPPALQ